MFLYRGETDERGTTIGYDSMFIKGGRNKTVTATSVQ